MSAPIIEIRNIVKRFPGGTIAVDNISFDIGRNEFFALLGPSGCGKTTLLRMIAGLEVPSEGQILLDGEDLAKIPANKRPVNMVFQSYAVFPHMNVLKNVEYGLMVTGTPKDETKKRAKEALDMVQLGHLAERMPDQLSGGQRQRVALARALVKRPKVLLLDEPLSALDAKLREAMQLELTRLQQTVGITFIIVTHDQDEALSMASRIAVMNNGTVSQIASPQELYEQPKSRFVADFIGKVNLLEAKAMAAANGKVQLATQMLGEIHIPHQGQFSGDVMLAVRPERLKLSESAPSDTGLIKLEAKVRDVAYYGDTSHVILTAPNGQELSVNVQNAARQQAGLARGRSIWVSWSPDDTLILTE